MNSTILRAVRRLGTLTAGAIALVALSQSATAQAFVDLGCGTMVADASGFPSCMLFQADFDGLNYQLTGDTTHPVTGLPLQLGDRLSTSGDLYLFFPTFCWSITGGQLQNNTNIVCGVVDPTSPFCFGDGTAGPCPCANFSAVGAGEGCLTSSGTGAKLSGSGTDSVLANDLVLNISGGPANEPAIFVSNLGTQPATPFYDGLFCLAQNANLWRIYPPAIFLDGNGNGSSSVSLVTNGGGQAVPGNTVYYQGWFRDPVGPCGSGANFTSGASVVWQP